MFQPHIIEKTGRNSKPIDITSRLLQDRIIYLGEEITQDVGNLIVMQLMWLNADNPDESIDLYISTPGGDISVGLAIKDIIYKIKPKVNTIGLGSVASMGTYLLASGTGKRSASENCRIMIHSVSSGYEGVIHDMKSEYEESQFLQRLMVKDLSEFSNKLSKEQIEIMVDRNNYMSSEEAIQYGFIDNIL